MVKRVEKTIKSSAVFSDNEKYRYLLTREWDTKKPWATVIMLNPSTADMLKYDKTVMNVNNFLIDKGYGAMTIVNLFAYRSTNPKELRNRDEEYEKLNDDYLIEAFEKADVIIVAWTRTNFKTRKQEVERIMQNYKHKVKCFEDGSGKKPRHPRDLGENWTLANYEYEFIDA